jgi:uncharacterized membrane protein YciS (DUF1049 family)
MKFSCMNQILQDPRLQILENWVTLLKVLGKWKSLSIIVVAMWLECVFAMGLQCGWNVFCYGFAMWLECVFAMGLQCGWNVSCNVFLQCACKKRQPYVFGQVVFF